MPIKGVRTRKKILAATGRPRFYYYVNRHAPESFFVSDDIDVQKLPKTPPEFASAYAAARKGLDERGTFGAAVLAYRASPERRRKADATRRDEDAYLELLLELPLRGGRHARKAPLSAFDDRRIIEFILAWRDSMAATPRKADMAVGTLARVLEFHRGRGALDFNRAAAIPKLYHRPIDEAEGWTDDELAAFTGAGCPDHLRLAVLFMRWTGARRTDAARLTLSAIKGDTLVWHTSKGRRSRRRAILPILPAGRAVLDELAAIRATLDPAPMTILFNSRGAPWTPDGLSTAIDKRRKKLGIQKTIHQLRKSYATDLILAHVRDPDVITKAVVCRAMGWGDAQFDDLVRVYADDRAVIASMVNRRRPENGHQADTATGILQPKES